MECICFAIGLLNIILVKQKKQIIGKIDYELIDKATADIYKITDDNTLNYRLHTKNEDTVVFSDDGHVEIIETIKSTITDESDNVYGVLGIARDITERKIAEEKLIKRKKLL